MSDDVGPVDPPGAGWTVAAVARRLGVAPETLRSWARRHGIGPAGHAPGQHRRYTDTDVVELEAMRALVARGMSLPAAAAVIRSRRAAGATRSAVVRSLSAAVDDLVTAAAGLDLDAATDILTAALVTHGVIPTWDRLCRPAIRELDAAAASEPGCADAHLLLSWAIGTCLHQNTTVTGSGGRPVLLACAAGEQHTLGPDALFAALRERRTPARMLGPSVPWDALRHAAAHLRPTGAVVWSQSEQTARPHQLRRLLPLADTVLAAGPGWHDVDVPPTVTRVDNLTESVELLTTGSLDQFVAVPARTASS